jgi:acetyl-CoA carboxylase carboxyl transferase subunit alpha
MAAGPPEIGPLTGPTGVGEEGPLERDLAEVERELRELRRITTTQRMDLAAQIAALEARAEELRVAIARNPSPWQTVQLARHPGRPRVGDYIAGLATEFVELHGDRAFRDDPAIVAGLGMVNGRPAALVGHAKGRDTRENIARNFGMPNPEGYRKGLRVMHLAEKMGAPVITLIDTPGAYPGKEAEERGQSEAIARALLDMARLRTPIVTVITGEGGSGGALAIGLGNAVLMLEHAIYSVISPEGCAAILWRDGSRGREAAQALRITARDLVEFGIIDEIIPEPPGGAHAHPDAAVAAVIAAVHRHLAALEGRAADALRAARYDKFRSLGRIRDIGQPEQPAGEMPAGDAVGSGGGRAE